jgi:hypothetical protein
MAKQPIVSSLSYSIFFTQYLLFINETIKWITSAAMQSICPEAYKTKTPFS